MTWLLDGNVLTALAIDTHQFHHRVHHWFDGVSEPFATCSVTEGTLLRLHLQYVQDGTEGAWQALRAIHEHPDHEFWEAGFSYLEVGSRGLRGSAQITDAWLAELVDRRRGRLATMDEALAARIGRLAFLVPRLAN